MCTEAASRCLRPIFWDYTVVVTKSTVPVGTAREVRRRVAEA